MLFRADLGLRGIFDRLSSVGSLGRRFVLSMAGCGKLLGLDDSIGFVVVFMGIVVFEVIGAVDDPLWLWKVKIATNMMLYL